MNTIKKPHNKKCCKALIGLVGLPWTRTWNQGIIEVAYTITEMPPIKHAFSQGIKAEQGVEF